MHVVPKIVDKIQPFPIDGRWRVLEHTGFSDLYGMKNSIMGRPVECLNDFYSREMFLGTGWVVEQI